ncbi:MAG TPA: sugar phosphate isomerase/epimerase family protein [Anaerolineales bacterium]|nr:sugar phosphate isomerase/epimerase family protein [Anaerolineales bacterium]
MNMLAFSTLACPGWSIETVLEKAIEFGYEGIEWRGGADGHVQPGMPAVVKATLRRMAGDAGLAALAVTTYTSFVSPLPAERGRNVDELRRYSDLAAELGAPFVRAFLGELPAGTFLDGQIYENIAACLWAASDYAATVGVKIAVEPHDDFTRSVVVSPIFDQFPHHPHLCVIWDLGNTFAAGEEPVEGFDVLKDRLAYVQVKDGKKRGSRWQLCPLGAGDVPLAQAFALLLDHGYDGAISVEWEYAWHPELDPPETALPAALRSVRKLLSAVHEESTC